MASGSSPSAGMPLLVVDFGSQYAHLVVRRCRDAGVFASLTPLAALGPIVAGERGTIGAVILSGGPSSVYAANAPGLPAGFWPWAEASRTPVLGVCYGMQLMLRDWGGAVDAAPVKEFGAAEVQADAGCAIFRELASTAVRDGGQGDGLKSVTGATVTFRSWMSHGDHVSALPPCFRAVARSAACPFAAVAHAELPFFGVQFHPEVSHTAGGAAIIRGFLSLRAGRLRPWSMSDFARAEIERLATLVGPRSRVIGALSGGVDSTVAAALMHRAIGARFRGFMVDTGLLRRDEGATVLKRLRDVWPDLRIDLIDASDTFFSALDSVTDPESKRKIIGKLFIQCFETAVEDIKKESGKKEGGKHSNKENQKVETVEDNGPGNESDADGFHYLLQGTLYPDVIESNATDGPAHTIKTHHNVGGLPEKLNLKIVEPLRELYKDEVRLLGIELGLAPALVWRHPFPGPGLAIRIVGAVTPARVALLQRADAIFIEELRAGDLYGKIGQAFAVLLPECRTVGVAGDRRSYGMTVALRAIETADFMTGDWAVLPPQALRKISSRITNEIPEITRVVYDVSSKPPATIEWE